MGLGKGFLKGAGVCISDADKRIVLTSEGHLDVLGRRREQVVGQSWEEWMTREDSRVASAKYDMLLKRKTPYDIVTHIIRPDGQAVPTVARCSTIQGRTPADDLVFCEMRLLEDMDVEDVSGTFACAAYVRDLAYELAAYTGRHRLKNVTQSLIEASASAEQAVEVLTRAVREVHV